MEQESDKSDNSTTESTERSDSGRLSGRGGGKGVEEKVGLAKEEEKEGVGEGRAQEEHLLQLLVLY